MVKGAQAQASDWITYVPDRPFNDKRYYISNNKLKQLGWQPKVTLEEGLLGMVRNARSTLINLRGVWIILG